MFKFPITLLRKAGLLSLILLFLIVGLNHFGNPNFYASIIPPYLPMRYELSNITGFFEIFGAIGLLFAKTRKLSGYGLILLLVVIFPANIYMVMHPENFPSYSPLFLYLHLPLQFLFIAWIYWATLRVKAVGPDDEY